MTICEGVDYASKKVQARVQRAALSSPRRPPLQWAMLKWDFASPSSKTADVGVESYRAGSLTRWDQVKAGEKKVWRKPVTP